MKDKSLTKILEDVKKKPSLMRTAEYVIARNRRHDLYKVIFEMGPNCNLKCFHCGTENSPDKEGLPDLETVHNTFTQAKENGIDMISLTSGEPLRDENKEAMSLISKLSESSPAISIVSNGTFGKTLENAEDWFYLLKTKGMDFSKGKNNLTISFGQPYNLPKENYFNINKAISNKLPEIDPGKFLYYRLINFGQALDIKKANEVIKTIYDTFGKRRSEYVSYKFPIKVRVYPSKGKPIKISFQNCDPMGRAYNLPVFDNIFPEKELQPKDLHISPKAGASLSITHNGDVDFCNSFGNFSTENSYGNINKQPLKEILKNIRKDVVFQAYKIGCTPFIYHIAQKADPNFKVIGKIRYNVAKETLGNAKVRNNIREYLTDIPGVLDTYFEYIHSLDLRKKPSC